MWKFVISVFLIVCVNAQLSVVQLPSPQCQEIIEDFTGPSLQHFSVDYCPQNIEINQQILNLHMTKECGTRISSNLFFTNGYFESVMKISGSPGVVSAFILRTDDTNNQPSDEIDVEWVGKSPQFTQSNYFIQSIPDYTRVMYHYMPASASEQKVKIGLMWSRQNITWFVNDQVARVLQNSPDLQQQYPGYSFRDGQVRPMRVQIGIWDGSQTSGWAGTVDYQLAPFSVMVDYIRIQTNCF